MRVARFARACVQLWSDVPLARTVEVRSHEDDVLVDRWRAIVRDFEFDFAIISKAGGRLAGHRIDGHQLPCSRKENPRRIVFVTRPVRDTSK